MLLAWQGTLLLELKGVSCCGADVIARSNRWFDAGRYQSIAHTVAGSCFSLAKSLQALTGGNAYTAVRSPDAYSLQFHKAFT